MTDELRLPEDLRNELVEILEETANMHYVDLARKIRHDPEKTYQLLYQNREIFKKTPNKGGTFQLLNRTKKTKEAQEMKTEPKKLIRVVTTEYLCPHCSKPIIKPC